MSDEKLLHEMEELKREVAKLKANRSMINIWKKTFSKTSILIGIALTFIVSSIIVYAASITKPYMFADDTVISATEVNSNFDALFSEINAKETRIATLEGNSHASLSLNFIICYEGVYPAPGGGTPDTQFLGEIRMFAGNYAPPGWFFCKGQELPIGSHTALFTILGTQYGGNGTTTFALPDLRGKVAIQPN